MHPKIIKLACGLAALFIMTASCTLLTPKQTPSPTNIAHTPTPYRTPTALPVAGATAQPGSQPLQLTGSFTYTNDFVVETFYTEQAVALVDMHGFVIRDTEWLLPVESQTLGYVKIDTANKQGTFLQQLPEQPTGVFDDVDNNGRKDTGVQIFAESYWPNLIGGPYSEGDDASRGWSSYLASVVTDPENENEVTGGKLVVWSPDEQQKFPSGFGADGKLFTADDPTAPLQPGYSVIDLDQKPFGILRDREPSLTLYEPKDLAIKNYASQSYTQAFDSMFAVVRKEYAFNGIQGKQPDWDALYARIQPQVKKAEDDHSGYEFYVALVNFTYAFKDGHVGLSGGDFAAEYFQNEAGGGYGLAVRELDDGSVAVVYVVKGSPAEKAGLQVGDRLTEFNGQPIAEAISAVQPLNAPNSSDFAQRYEQTRYLLRAAVGASASITFTHNNGAAKTVKLKTVDERDSLIATSPYQNYDPNALPVEFKILDTGQGYVRVNSNHDDLNLILRLFKRALDTFKNNSLSSVIIDMRQNSGGANLGLAAFLTDQVIQEGQLEYYSDQTGKFEPRGKREKIYPNEEQYHFDKIALLVDQTCYSACELESYAFSQVPGMKVIGTYPTAGVEAEVARGQFEMPEGLSLQVPTGRFTLPDGSLFLEGQGVAPSQRVPVTLDNILANQDVVLKAAEDALK